MSEEIIRGYKMFNEDWTGLTGFQFECPGTYETEEFPIVLLRGFHFCRKLKDCMDYMGFDKTNKIAEVVALGDVDSDTKKCCTDKIQLVREISRTEALLIIVEEIADEVRQENGGCAPILFDGDMTVKEALQILRNVAFADEFQGDDRAQMAFNMAVSALKIFKR